MNTFTARVLLGLGAAILLFSGQLALAADNISQINFFTPPRAVAPGAVSEVITIQTQNAAGEEEQLSETADLALTSSSPTGEFSSSASNWKPDNKLTMNTGWAKRNFYYRDSSAGSHTITAVVTTRETQRSWQATQEIAVGDDVQPPPSGGNGGGGEEELGEPAEPEIKPPAGRLKVSSLGKKRIVGVSSSVLFRANVSGGGGAEPHFVWTFGDGSTATGQKVEHIYRFPGDHTVILNVSVGEEQITVRGNVKVFQPEIIVTEVQTGSLDDSYTQLENRSAYEVNLGKFRLEAPGGSFVFPPDTIIGPKTKINFPSAITRLAPSSPAAVRIIYPNGRPVLSFARPEAVVSIAPAQEAALAQMRIEVLRLAEAVKKLKPPASEIRLPAAPPPTSPTTPPATTTVLELPRPAGFFNRGFGFIKNIFGGNESR